MARKRVWVNTRNYSSLELGVMKKYKDLNLAELRKKVDLDFAHYTYQEGMCACCYGPKDLPSLYWKDRIVRTDKDITYVLFKNADNGSGHVTANDYIEDKTYIGHHFRDNRQMLDFCYGLQEQLGPEYIVEVPADQAWCITLRLKVCMNQE